MNIVVLGRPRPKQRPRMNPKTGRFYTPRRTSEYEDQIAWSVLGSDETFAGDVILRVVYYLPDRKPVDLDNLLKATIDGLQKGRLVENDAQVKSLYAEICYDEEQPRTEIEIEPLNSIYCNGESAPIIKKGDDYYCSKCGSNVGSWIVT